MGAAIGACGARSGPRSAGTWLTSAAIDILLLCSGNICRSPMAEALFRDRLQRRSISATVSSAGLLYDGRAATPTGVEVMAARGIDTSSHQSRLLRAELLEVDLVLGMAREHVREAVLLRPELFPRTFTLKELVRRGEAVGPRGPDEPHRDWFVRVSEGRQPRELLGASTVDDVADPIGQGHPVYEQTAAELDDLIGRAVALIWPPTL